ncbi:MAG: DNA polymerase II [Nanoarchaeota archaeon]
MKGFIVDAGWKTIDEKTELVLFGRLENRQSFAAILDFIPYFFIKERDSKNIKELIKGEVIEKTNLVNFKGEKVLKITAKNQTDFNKIVHSIHSSRIDTYESDIKPYARFAIDNEILGGIEIGGDYETSERVDRVYRNPEIRAVRFKPKLKVASIDIETGSSGELYCIGVYTEEYKKNFMVTDKELKDTIKCKNEADCLEKWKKEMIKLDSDIITGWNVIDFDFVYLKSCFEKNSIKLDIGRDNSEIRLRIEENFLKKSSAAIKGRQVIDGLSLVRDPFIKEAPSIKKANFDSYTLEDVSRELLRDEKLIKGKNRHSAIEMMYKTEPQKVADYNLQDCKLAYNIIEKTDMLNLAVERAMLTGLLLDRLTASIAAFDSLYIREARRAGLVCPTTRYGLKEERITGGYVLAPTTGIYKNVLVLDFKSLYPSIIRTFNIDPASLLEKKEMDCVVAPNGALFKNKEGILPKIIEKFHEAREEAKKGKRELASYAIKIIMNSFFGVLASPNCRFYNFDMANAITHFGQAIIKLTAEKIEEFGFKVIYSDTDSIFIETGLENEKAEILGNEIQEKVNRFYKDYIKENYSRQSFLELQFDKQFISLLFPKMRKTEVAAKKRYAGLVLKDGEKKLEITGLEAIRGDWTEAAKEFQKELLLKVFNEEDSEEFIKKFIKRIEKGEVDEKLVYAKSIRKALNEYTKITPPHVKAARQLDKLEGNIIKYYITTAGPEPIQKLKHKIDYKHYIEKQIKPIANQILETAGKSFESIADEKQKKLF